MYKNYRDMTTTKLARKKISDSEMIMLKLHQMSTTGTKRFAVGKKYTAYSDSDNVGIDVKCTQDCPTVIKSLATIKNHN
jgi:hypothetical protein